MLNVDDMGLPRHRHLPGINKRPDDGFLHGIAQQAHGVTRDHRADENLPWMYGIHLINEGYYWEAHEVLEPVWMNAPPNSRMRFLVQCLIHVSNARLKLALKQERAAKRLQALAVAAAERACTGSGDVLMTLDKRVVLSAAATCGEASIRCTFNTV